MKALKIKQEDVEINSFLADVLSYVETGVAIPQDTKDISLSNFTRLIEGENKFRLLLAPIRGTEVWCRRDKVDENGELVINEDGTPRKESKVLRYRPTELVIIPQELSSWEKDKRRRFMALLVYNYNTGAIECLVANNTGLYEMLFENLKHGEDAINPFVADFTVTKKHDRKAVIDGKPIDIYKYFFRFGKEQKVYPEEILNALRILPVGCKPELEKLYDGGDPFDFTFDESEILEEPA